MTADFKLGLTKPFACNYLPEQDERLLIAVDERFHDEQHYSWLMGQGFRRSGEQLYRPHCESCSQCQSLRVMVNEFTPSKSQKRLLKKNSAFNVAVSNKIKESYYPLYERYINEVHKDGAMFPASEEQFSGFLNCSICPIIFIELWHANKLVSVAVTDKLSDSLSAVYTFYDPSYKPYGIGVLSILKQIEVSVELGKKFLYLGYQIDHCQKMNYKNRYFPHQRLVNQTWQIVNK